MNERAWDALEKSAAFGIELHNQLYADLRKAAAEALSSVAISDADIKHAGMVKNQSEADEIARLNREREENAKTEAERKLAAEQEDIQYQLLITAALHHVPKFDYNLKRFSVDTQDEIQSLANTVIWLNRYGYDKNIAADWRPYYILGYKYTNNSALLAQPLAANTDAYLQTGFITKLYDLKGQGMMNYIHTGSMYQPDSILATAKLATYVPGKADHKHFEQFARQDFHVLHPTQTARCYSRKDNTFQLGTNESDIIYSARYNRKSNLDVSPVEAIATNLVFNEGIPGVAAVVQDYGILDLGLVRLMTNFQKGQQYHGILQDGKYGYVANIVAAQQSRLMDSDTQSVH